MTKKKKTGSQKAERYIQPSILLALKQKASYGYELIQDICRFGFVEGAAPPGMIYRHLRDLEQNGLVSSEWQTDESGPAKRIYNITSDGLEILEVWIHHMAGQVEKLNNFIAIYKEISASPEQD